MQLQWNRDMQYALGFSKVCCQVLGIWPTQCNGVLPFLRRLLLLISQIVACVFLLDRLIRYGNCGLATHLIEAWCGITGFTGTAIKIVIFSVHKDRIYRIIQLAMLDWANARETSVRQIMSQYAQRGRIAYIAQIGAAAMIVFEISLTRLPCFTVDSFENNYSSTRNLILGPPCWIPSTMPASLYFVYYFSTFIGLWVIVFFYTGCDAFMIAAALHICCQLEILNASLENLSDEDSHTHQRFRINEYSKRHNKLLVLGNELNHAVQLIIFADIFSNMSVICISGIAILVNVRNENMNNDILNLVLRMCLGYTGLFMYSYVGEKLSSQADKSRTILYACPWYNMPMDIVKDIGFMIMLDVDMTAIFLTCLIPKLILIEWREEERYIAFQQGVPDMIEGFFSP